MAKSRNVANLIAANLLPASNTITTSMIVDNAITTSKIASGAVTLPDLDTSVTANFPTTIAAVYITNSSYVVQPDQALPPGGGYIKLTGSGFYSGAQIYINNTPALSTTYISTTEIRAQVPSLTAGYYHIYVQNTNGMAAIRANGLYVSSAPTWVTGSSIGGSNNVPFGIQLSAVSDTSVTYSVASGSSLPSGVTLTQLGYLSGTISGLSTTTVYSIDIVATDSETQSVTRTFTLSISVAEQYFNQTALLLQGNFTNAVTTNSTFLDTSQTAAGITKTGNVSQGTFSPFSQTGWSNYFNGSTDYLSLADNANLEFGSSTITVECWFYMTGTSGYILDKNNSGTGLAAGFSLYISTTGVTWYYDAANNGYIISPITTTITQNAWHHIALVRSVSGSTTNSIFVDGVRIGTSTTATAFPDNAQNFRIGCTFLNGSIYTPFTGYISNVRMVKGTAVYDPTLTTLTVPTAPLTAVANTQLLTCQSNRFVDNSTNAYALTPSGTPLVQSFSPFPPANSYLSTLNGGGSYYDGSGDYLTINPSTVMTIGTSDATVEMWMYPTAQDGYRRIVTSNTGAFTTGSFAIRYNNGNFAAGALGGNYITYSGYPVLNAWNHVAWVGVGGNSQTLYLNGRNVGTSTTYNITESIQYLGGYYSTGPAEFYQGHLGDVRVMKGTALFTGNFTVPSAPLTRSTTSATNVAVTTGSTTSLLMNFTNQGVMDATSKNNVETVGTVATQTTYFKYGGGALNFTGAGFLSMPNTPTLNIGTGAFTIEAWVYLTAAPANNIAYTLLSNYSGTTASSRYWYFGITTGTAAAGLTTSGTGSITFATTLQGTNNGSIYATPTWIYNQWNHIAVSRDASNNWYIFYNGTSLTTSTAGTWSASTDYTVSTTAAPTYNVGAQPANAASSYFVGYVDELRFTKGIARFTANFTPATSDLASQ